MVIKNKKEQYNKGVKLLSDTKIYAGLVMNIDNNNAMTHLLLYDTHMTIALLYLYHYIIYLCNGIFIHLTIMYV
jgi:hypothetical protein